MRYTGPSKSDMPLDTDLEVKIIKHDSKNARARHFFFILLFAATTISAGARAAAEEVSVWVYHNFPPYIVNATEREGISYDLVRLLTEMSDGRFQFNVEVLPRPRLEKRFMSGDPGIVLWVNHVWFGDPDRTRFLWTNPILADKNVIVSPKGASFQYEGPQSLHGMTLIGVRGHSYTEVDGLVKEGLVDRIDLNAEGQLMRFVASGRGQVAIIANSAARYFVRELDLSDAIHFSKKPHSTYQRYIMVQPHLEPLHEFLQEAILRLKRSEEWTEIVQKYGLNAAPLR